MPSLESLIPEIQAYQQARGRGIAEQGAALNQMGALQGILAKARAEQEAQAFRGALSQAKTPEEQAQIAAQYGGPDAVLRVTQGSLDRKAALDAANTNREAQREQRLHELEIRGEQEIARVREAEKERRITKEEADRREATMRENMARLAASLRPAPQPRSPVAIMKDGKPMYVDPKDAIGQQPAVKETADRVVPANIAKAYTENATALRKIDTALDEVSKYPEAFGLQNMRGDALSQRIDPKGVTARAIVADIGSLKIHDRSGAAVTAAETPRLLPFIPNVNDRPEVVKKKLALFRKEYEAIQNDIGSMYSAEQGYKALPSAQTRATDKPANPVDALLEKYK